MAAQMAVLTCSALLRQPTLAVAPMRRQVITTLRGGASLPRMDAGLGLVATLGAVYSNSLTTAPIVTQSLTAAGTFALSDAAAQAIAPPKEGRDAVRTITTALIGLLYFGPALHFYLRFVYSLFPGTGLRATLLKTLFGQLGFGPAVTCVFFAAFLVKDLGLAAGIAKLPSKIRQDLFVTWTSELCFWPFVDLICYSLVPVRWIPLGYNAANFLWTIYLSLQAAREVKKRDGAD